jgi:hypothetical protein
MAKTNREDTVCWDVLIGSRLPSPETVRLFCGCNWPGKFRHQASIAAQKSAHLTRLILRIHHPYRLPSSESIAYISCAIRWRCLGQEVCSSHTTSPPTEVCRPDRSFMRLFCPGSSGLHRYLVQYPQPYQLSLSLTRLSAHAVLLCAPQWSERSILPPLCFVKLTLLACLSVSPIESTTSCQVFLPKVGADVIQIPWYLLALSDEVAPSIVPVSLCRLFFLLDRLPFRTLHTCICIPAIHIHSHEVTNIR